MSKRRDEGRYEGYMKHFVVPHLLYDTHCATSLCSTVRVGELFLFLFKLQAGGERFADDGAEGDVVMAK